MIMRALIIFIHIRKSWIKGNDDLSMVDVRFCEFYGFFYVLVFSVRLWWFLMFVSLFV